MLKNKRRIQVLSVCWLVAAFTGAAAQQEFLPAAPADHSLIYVLDQQNHLLALPFERAETPLHPEQVAKSTRVSYIELKGDHSATVLSGSQRLFLFKSDSRGAHPPLLVWLTPHHGARRVTAIVQRGQ